MDLEVEKESVAHMQHCGEKGGGSGVMLPQESFDLLSVPLKPSETTMSM